ncbi:MAG: hypothetical protein M0P31_15395 [Solirubrobacteraceae bacterium]|nr:hypothetical protein [Solirubrobacteraceae bacterium]
MAGMTGGAFSATGKNIVGGIKPQRLEPVSRPWTPPEPMAGHVLLWSTDTGATTALRYREPVQVVQERAGGWRSIPRPQLRPLTTWDGHQAIQLRVTGDLNGWEAQRPVVDELRALRGLGGKVSSDVRRPHVLRVIGRSVPIPTVGDDPTWVITALEVVEELHVGGLCARALCTVTLEQYVEATVELRVARQQKAAWRWYRWRKGDTPYRVAKRELRDGKRQREIKKLNPKVKRWSSLTTKDRVKIPAR